MVGGVSEDDQCHYVGEDAQGHGQAGHYEATGGGSPQREVPPGEGGHGHPHLSLALVEERMERQAAG